MCIESVLFFWKISKMVGEDATRLKAALKDLREFSTCYSLLLYFTYVWTRERLIVGLGIADRADSGCKKADN